MRTSFNYSSITTARKCQTLYQKQYILGEKQEGPENGDFAFGHAIHAGCEAVLEGDDGVKTFNLFWENDKGKDIKYSRFGYDELKEQGGILVERFARLHAKKFKDPIIEQTLAGSIHGVQVYGTPDVIGEFEGVPSVLDFKTAGYRYHKNKAHVGEQLYGYAHLAEQALKYKATQLVYMVFIKGREPSIQVLKTERNLVTEAEILKDWASEINALQLAEKSGSFKKNRQACIEGDRVCPYFKTCTGKGLE
jgi:hypothetical protein